MSHRAFLPALFLFSLLIFSWVRWDPAPLVQARVQASPLATWVSLEGIHKGFTGLHIDQLEIKTARPLHLQEVKLTPQWLQIIMGTWAVDIQGKLEGQPVSLHARLEQGKLVVERIDFQVPASSLSTFLPIEAPVQLDGGLLLQGDITLQLEGMQPLSGTLDFRWHEASAGFAGMQQVLGDYQGELLSGGSAWEWHISGGELITVKGDGLLQSADTLPSWALSGSLDVKAKGSSAGLMSAVAGSSHAKLYLQGTIKTPSLRWQPVR